MLVPLVTNIAIGDTNAVEPPNPMLWFVALKVATNSIVPPTATAAGPARDAPSMASLPLASVAPPPATVADAVQPSASDAPENSVAWTGASVISPSPVSDRYVPAPNVPPPRSATVLNTWFELSSLTIVTVARRASVSVPLSGLLMST